MIRLRSAWSVVALALPLAACARDAQQPAIQTGSSHVLLTDGPFPYDRLARVDLYVVNVSASLSTDTAAGSGGFVTLVTPNRRFDVLALQNGATAELGSLDLPTGAITAVRMVIDTDSSSITLRDGRVLTGANNGIHWQSSAGRPTLNALIHEQIAVPDSGAEIVIDYDLGRAFTSPQVLDSVSADSSFTFMPQFRAVDATRTGTITGVVRAHTAAGTPVARASVALYLGNPANPENTWTGMASGMTDSTGAFRISYVTRSAWWAGFPAWTGATYIVAVDPPSGAGLGRTLVPNLTVQAGQATSAGTIVLP
jgi:hypothetical protein